METVISIGDIHGDFKVILEVLFNELHKRKGINKLIFQLVTNDNVINIATITKSQFEIKQNNPLDYQEDINSVFELIKDLILTNSACEFMCVYVCVCMCVCMCVYVCV